MKAILIELNTEFGVISNCCTKVPRHLINELVLHSSTGLFAYCSVKADLEKIKAIMINKAIGEAALQIKQAEERIEKLRGLRNGC